MKFSKMWSWCILGALNTSWALASASPKYIGLQPIGRFLAGGPEHAEISAYDPGSRRLFSIDPASQELDVLDLTHPALPALAFTVPLGGRPNSVAVREGLVAVALENAVKTAPGTVAFFNADGMPLGSVVVGALPDMLTFSPNGDWLLVANEGEPNSYGLPDSVDPPGSVSIIDLRDGAPQPAQSAVRTVGFDAAIPLADPASLRIFGPGASLAQDLEPEYITISLDSKTAWITLQENNGLAVLDIEAGVFTQLRGLGLKDHGQPGSRLDPSDRDGGILLGNWPVSGLAQPDAIASYHVGGATFLVLANEGDTRDYPGFNEEVRVGSAAYALEPSSFPAITSLKSNASLGRLTVTNQSGDLDGDGDFDQIIVPGWRSFSIRAADGGLIFDSGDDLEEITAAAVPALFNSAGTAATFDTRSDNKGPEPEGVAVGKAFGRHYAFIGLERTGGVMVYEITNPFAPVFIRFVHTGGDDLAPEGLHFISEEDSPHGKPLLAVSYEVSGTVTLFEITAP